MLELRRQGSILCVKNSERCFSKSCHSILPQISTKMQFIFSILQKMKLRSQMFCSAHKSSECQNPMATSHILWALPPGYPYNRLTKMSPVFLCPGFPFASLTTFQIFFFPFPTQTIKFSTTTICVLQIFYV